MLWTLSQASSIFARRRNRRSSRLLVPVAEFVYLLGLFSKLLAWSTLLGICWVLYVIKGRLNIIQIKQGIIIHIVWLFRASSRRASTPSAYLLALPSSASDLPQHHHIKQKQKHQILDIANHNTADVGCKPLLMHMMDVTKYYEWIGEQSKRWTFR